MYNIKNLPGDIKKHLPIIATVSSITAIAVVVANSKKSDDHTYLDVSDDDWNHLMAGGSVIYTPGGVDIRVKAVK